MEIDFPLGVAKMAMDVFGSGRATRELIRLHLSNTVDGFCDGAKQFCEDLNDYLMQNYLWMQQNIASYPSNRYWIQVNMTLNQLLGMIDGYEGTLGRSWAVEELVAHPLYLIQLAGDIEDLAAKFGRPETPAFQLLPDFSDIYFSHVTWASYSSMLRMQKRYTFATNDPGHSYSFSGYPGSISSVDDFVLTASRLAILETTISNYNERLYKYVTPASVLCWVRAQVAHRTSSSGLQWAKVFSRFNSGTYNNQWNVLDYKMFKRNRRDHPSHGLLHVLEQLPNHTAHADMTHALFRNTYWPSYNSPYDKTPRALIFQRDHGSVVDMDSMIRLMRSNNYTKDPLSKCECDPPYSAENAISCRSDLNPPNGTYPFPALGHRDHGATDMKVTNSQLIESLSFTAIAGPTHDPTPVFDWSASTLAHSVPHNGQPVRWT
uniref:Phospholipase B-like n=1 Tax=Angiostrongylus cantonensis TaxID=6313 RepID=A0A0K0CWA5_ANGCA